MTTTLSQESIALMEYVGWTNCGGDYWEHGEYPMQQIHASEAIKIAREQIRKENTCDAQGREKR